MSITLNGTTGITSSGGYTGDGLSVADNAPANALQIDASGNLGVGTSSPASKLDVIAATNSGIRVSDGTYTGTFVPSSLGGMAITTGGAYPLIYYINGSERSRIDSSGNLLVGTTSNPAGAKFVVGGGGTGIYALQTTGSGYNYSSNAASNAGTYYHFVWYSGGTYTGEIRASSSTTTYATASDYRLKEDIQPMTGALAKVAQLKPVTYKWKADGSDGEGFIAHELQEVVPQAVTGEKDAVDAEGNPQYQGIDTSFLAGLYAAAIQELKAMVDAQAVEIAQLKGQA